MKNMILIDLETQDFDVKAGIYEVACIAIEEYRIVDQLYLGKKIDGYQGELKFGRGFHNICRDKECMEAFKKFIGRYNYPLVAHNCSFDRKFLLYYRWIDRNYPAYCSLRTIKAAVKALNSYSLHNLVRHYQVAEGTDHTAMSDTLNLYRILSIIRPETWVPVHQAYTGLTGSEGMEKKIGS